jgi:acetate---CoA ligase (ADP-forming)
MRGAKLLTGYRGRPDTDTDAIEQLLERVSLMGEMIPEITEMDLNPVVVKEKGAGVTVLDCRMIISR